MRWLTWMATVAFVGVCGCGGSGDGGATTSAPEVATKPPAGSGGTKSSPAGGDAGSAAAAGAKTAASSTRRSGAGTAGQAEVKDSLSPRAAEQTQAARGAGKAPPAHATPALEPEPADEGPPEMPKVHLGQGRYAQSTLLKVGDPIPELAVSDLAGAATTVAAPGEGELLVLVFWDSTNAYSTLELRWLERAFTGREGVRVVGINRGEPAETVRGIVEKEKLSFPVLLDGAGSVFGQFATETVPRTYLIGAGGEIVWLEVTFQGRTTIQALEQALAAAQAE